MQYGKAIYYLLNGATAAGDRIYPIAAAQQSALPYIVYKLISSIPHNSFNKTASVITHRVQIDMITNSYASCHALEEQVRNNLIKRDQGAYGTTTTIQNIDFISMDDDQYEDGNSHYIISADYEIRESINTTD